MLTLKDTCSSPEITGVALLLVAAAAPPAAKAPFAKKG